MAKELNFSSTYYKCYKRGWGDRLYNGSYTGMVGIAHAGHVDLIGASLTLRPSRARGISYLHPIGLETYSLLLPSVRKYVLVGTMYRGAIIFVVDFLYDCLKLTS